MGDKERLWRTTAWDRRPSERWSGGVSARMPAAAAVAGLAASVSYMAQRLAALAVGSPSGAEVLATEHIPFYWRCAMALWHGLALGLVAWLLLRDERRAQTWVDRLTAAVPPTVGVLIALTVVFP